MTGRARVAKKSGQPVIDPYLPTTGNYGYRVSRYELELEYKVTINRLAGSATINAVTLAELKAFTLDLSDALAVSKVTVNGKRPSQFRTSAGKLHVHHGTDDLHHVTGTHMSFLLSPCGVSMHVQIPIKPRLHR